MEITAILIKAVTFVLIIFMGYGLKRIGFFQEKDFFLLSKIVLKITLPAAIASSLSGMEVAPSMLILALFGFGSGVLLMLAGYLINIKKGKQEQAFAILNLSGYNVGNFALPFVQSFLGPLGMMSASLFDSGNAFICLGGAYSVAAMVGGVSKGKNPLLNVIKALGKSVPFLVYLLMVSLCLLHLSLPQPVVSFAGTIADANAFLAMLMLGVGFNIKLNKEYTQKLMKYLLLRYGIAGSVSLFFYFCLPFALETRQAMVLITMAPISSSSPAFTGEMGGDVGLSSACNSLSIIISIVIMTILLLVMLT